MELAISEPCKALFISILLAYLKQVLLFSFRGFKGFNFVHKLKKCKKKPLLSLKIVIFHDKNVEFSRYKINYFILNEESKFATKAIFKFFK